MGLLSKAIGLVQKIAPVIPGAGGIVAKGVGLLAKVPGLKVAKAGVGLAAGGAAFEAGGRLVRGRGAAPKIDPRTGLPFPRKKRRAGLSGRDILGAQKVARVVSAFGYKPKFKKRKGRR